MQYLTMKYKLPDDMKPQTQPIAEQAWPYLCINPLRPWELSSQHIHLNTPIFLLALFVVFYPYILMS